MNVKRLTILGALLLSLNSCSALIPLLPLDKVFHAIGRQLEKSPLIWTKLSVDEMPAPVDGMCQASANGGNLTLRFAANAIQQLLDGEEKTLDVCPMITPGMWIKVKHLPTGSMVVAEEINVKEKTKEIPTE